MPHLIHLTQRKTWRDSVTPCFSVFSGMSHAVLCHLCHSCVLMSLMSDFHSGSVYRHVWKAFKVADCSTSRQRQIHPRCSVGAKGLCPMVGERVRLFCPGLLFLDFRLSGRQNFTVKLWTVDLCSTRYDQFTQFTLPLNPIQSH